MDNVLQVMMPPGAAEVRASQKSILTGIVYDKVCIACCGSLRFPFYFEGARAKSGSLDAQYDFMAHADLLANGIKAFSQCLVDALAANKP